MVTAYKAGWITERRNSNEIVQTVSEREILPLGQKNYDRLLGRAIKKAQALESYQKLEKSGQLLRPMHSFDAALRTALEFISNPHKLWKSG